jgi:hypothetical protein
VAAVAAAVPTTRLLRAASRIEESTSASPYHASVKFFSGKERLVLAVMEKTANRMMGR